MESKLTKSLVLITVLMVAFAGGPGGAAGAAGTVSVDSSTTGTSHTSEITNSSTVQGIEGNASNSTTVELQSDSNKSKVKFNRSGTGMPTIAINASGVNVAHNASGNNNNNLNHSVSHDQLLDTEHSPGENVTMKAWLYNNSSHTSPATSNFTWFADFSTATGTEVITDADANSSDFVTVTNESSWFGWSETDKTRVEKTDVAVPNDTYYIAAANASAADDLSRSLDAFQSGEKISVAAIGAYGPNAFIKVSDSDKTVYVPVYAESAPDSVDTSTDLYAVASSTEVGGTSGVAIHNIDEEFDSSTVDITMATGTGTDGWFWGYAMQGFSSFGPMNLGGGGAFAISGGAAFLFAARPRRAS